MRRQLCTSSGPSNSTLGASVPGPSWATSTWRWRTLQLLYKHTGQSENGINTHFREGFFHQAHKVFFLYQTCHRGEQAWLPCLVWPGSNIRDPQDAILLFVLLSEGSPAPVCWKRILTKAILQPSNGSWSGLWFENVWFVLQAQWLTYVGRAGWKLWKTVTTSGGKEGRMQPLFH